MANNLDISTITGINQVGNSYQRKNPIPLDYYSFFNTRADAENYAQNGAVSYVGQVIAFKESATDASVKVCVIKNEAGELEALNNVEVKVPGVKQGTYITVTTDANGDYTIAHANAAQMTVTPEAEKKTTFVTEITRDEQGHITGYKTATVEIPDVSLDKKSIDRTEDEAKAIEIKGFAKAANLTVPQKGTDGEVHWVTIDKAIEGATENTITTGDAGSIDAPTTGSIVHKQIDNGYEVSIKGANTATAGQVLKAKGNGDVEWTDDADTLGKNIVGSRAYSTENESVSNGPVYLNHVENDEVVSSVEFVASGNIVVTADANGQINIGDTFTPPDITVDLNPVEEAAEVGLVDVVQDFDADGHAITGNKIRVATKAYVDRVVTGATDYLGTVGTAEQLAALNPGKGDFVRVSIAFDDYHASDMLICETPKDGESAAIWSVIHGEIDANTWVANTKDADGYVAKTFKGLDENQQPIYHTNSIWASDNQGNPGWIIDNKLEKPDILLYTTDGAFLTHVEDENNTPLTQSEIDASVIRLAGMQSAMEGLADYATDIVASEQVLAWSGGGNPSTELGYSNNILVAREQNTGHILVPLTPDKDAAAASKKYVDEAKAAALAAIPTVNDGQFTVSGTGYLTGTGSMTANQAGDTTAALDLSEEAQALLQGAMQKLDSSNAQIKGHYAIFDANGQVVDGGVIEHQASISSIANGQSQDSIGIDLFTKAGLSDATSTGLYISTDANSGLDLSPTLNSNIAIANLSLSESTKASLAKADTALQGIVFDSLANPTDIGSSDEAGNNSDLGYTTAGFTVTVQTSETTDEAFTFELETTPADGIVFYPNFGDTSVCGEEKARSKATVSLAPWAKNRITESISEVTTTVGGGLKTATTYTYTDGSGGDVAVDSTDKIPSDVLDYTKTTTIDIDETTTFILNCGTAADLLE